MLNVVPGFDAERRMITISITTNLLVKYFDNFSGLIIKANDKNMPEGIKVEPGKKSNEAIIMFPLPESSSIKKLEDKQSVAISINTDNMKAINKAVNKFINGALRRELKTTEFIPLSGYPIEELQKDIKIAIEAKRNFCLLETYQEYLDMQKENKYIFHQYICEYGTSDYADVAILIEEGNLDEIKNTIGKKITLTDWC